MSATRVETVQEKNQKTLLPFAHCPGVENELLKSEVEKAAVFCLAELDREKGGGLFRKKLSEKTVFIAEVYYPFWIASFRELTLLFDGLNLSSNTLTFPAIPDIKIFTDNVNDRSSTRQSYSNFLSDHVEYFQNSNGEKTKVVEGLISDLDFIREFSEYVKEGTTTEKPVVDGVLISPAFTEKLLITNVKELEESYAEVAQEGADLSGIIKLLNAKTQRFIAGLQEEITAIEKKFVGQIEDAEAALAKKKSQINNDYSEKVTELSNKFEQETVALSKEVIKLEKERENLSSEIEHVEAEIKTAIINKDDGLEQKWKEKRNELKGKLPDIASTIKNLQEKIQAIEENKKNELFQARQENDAELKNAGKDLQEIESTRDAEKKNCQDEMEKIEELTSKINGDIDKLSKMMETALGRFDSLGIRQEEASFTLVYMPFYLSSHLSDSKKRFNYVAPSIVSSMDINARLKAIGKKKITLLLQPRSQKLISILNNFVVMLGENVAFSHEINEACSKVDLMRSKESVESIKNGLSELKTQGWLSDDEFVFFGQVLT